MSKKRDTPFPTIDQVAEFIRDSDGPVGKREIARAFDIRGQDRARLNDMLRELRRKGEVARSKGRRFAEPGTLPNVGVVVVTAIDADGDPVAQPVAWDAPGDPPAVFVATDRRRSAPAIGDRLLSRLSQNADGTYTARVIKMLERAPHRVLGIFRTVSGQGRIVPTNRRIRTEFVVPRGAEKEAEGGDLVVAETSGRRSLGLPEARVTERIGSSHSPKAPSLIAIHSNDIPTVFTRKAIADAEAAKPVSPHGRTDLRALPLITIDGADARDFDDAVWAEPDETGGNKGGWHLIVAIADVAWYVHPGSALDKCAYERGNSVYFPDQVVPMLPEALSNGLCSLVPAEDRGCLAVHMWIDRHGNLHNHQFVRGIMRSAARLTYEQVEAARRGLPDDTTGPLMDRAIAPLYGAFDALQGARARRGTIDLDLPERKVVLDAKGRVADIVPVQRLDSHRLIEEFMISANVAAAETLERRNAPCLFRVHDEPSLEKMEGLRETLSGIGVSVPRGQVIKPETFQRIVARVAGTPEAHMVNMAVLRSQAQAEYAPTNIGHFGLALRRYAHFTSPIRRYADLLVHRSLIAALGLGEGGLRPEDGDGFAEFGKHVSFAERRAVDAERDAVDRFTTLFLADRVGATFAARVNGVHRAGLFITLDDSGADGLVPMSMMGDERFDYDAAAQKITGRDSRTTFRIGDPLTVVLAEANIHTGSLAFSLDGRARSARSGATAVKGKGSKKAKGARGKEAGNKERRRKN